jgi:hypothetical protein
LEVVEVNSIRVSVSGVLGLAVTICAAVAFAGAPVPQPTGVGVYSQTGNYWLAYDNSVSVKFPSDLSVLYGNGALQPIVGDWDGDGNEGIGLFSPTSGTFWLQDDTFPSPQSADLSISNFTITDAGDTTNQIAFAGDFNGDDIDDVGLYDPATGTWRIRHSLDTGTADRTFVYGDPGLLPVVGNWDNTGGDGVGVYTSSGNFWLKNLPQAGAHNFLVPFGDGTLTPVVGEWVAGTVSVGLYNPGSGAWHVSNDLSGGSADASFQYGAGSIGLRPVVGTWEVVP